MQFLGKKDIEAVLLPGEGDNVSTDGADSFHALPYERSSEDQRSNLQFSSRMYVKNYVLVKINNFLVQVTKNLCLHIFLWIVLFIPL